MYTIMDMCSGEIERGDVSADPSGAEMAGAAPEDRNGVSLQFVSPDIFRRGLPSDLAVCDIERFLQKMAHGRD